MAGFGLSALLNRLKGFASHGVRNKKLLLVVGAVQMACVTIFIC
jgi:hypothetical protein